jgi:hypothetical protein
MTANGKFKFPALLDELVRVDAAIVGASTAPTSMALTCRWRSRPQHQKETHALQQSIEIY